MIKFKLLVLAFILLSLNSCKKDDPISPNDNNNCNDNTPQMLSLDVDMVFNEDTFQENQSFRLNDTTYISFTSAYIYFSNISLVSDNETQKTADDVILLSTKNQSFQLGVMEINNYDGLRVSFGIDSVRNHADPTQYPAKHPLGLQNPSMHWSWNQGYIFALLEGAFSNNPITSDNPGEPWAYHIGLDGNYQESGLIPIDFSIKGCNSNTLNLKVNMAKVFEGIDVNNENVTHTSNFFELSNKIGQNLINSISYDN